MNRRLYLVAALAIVVIAGAAVWVVVRTDPTSIGPRVDTADLPVLADSVPGLDGAKGWLNTEPLTAEDLAGKVVVYDFWTYSCINCVRTLPHVRAWYDRYAPDGLVVVGVHSPEFDFEKNHDNVARAVQELGVNWPVALDDDMDIWSAFQNQYWPAKYIADREGHLRYVHYGEGNYEETENVIRALLAVPVDSPRAGEDTTDDVPPGPGGQTPETYLGVLRGVTASPEGLTSGEQTFTVPASIPPDSFALDGAWRVEDEFVESTADGAAIVLAYQGTEVNLVMDTADGAAIDVVVELDGAPVPESALPDGMTVDAAGNTIVTVDAADLYRLVLHGPTDGHVLRITPQAEGLQAFAFTFGAG